jgi:hypothetical protein
MEQQGKQVSMRQAMPSVAEFIDAKRTEWGADWVNAQIKAGLAGQADCFYAFEGGQVLGTPFTGDPELMALALQAAAMGGKHVVVIRPPAGTKQ